MGLSAAHPPYLPLSLTKGKFQNKNKKEKSNDYDLGEGEKMAKAFKKRSKLLNVARKLPPSYHTLPGQDFDIKKSEVINWLIDQPEILNYLWNNIKQSGDVFYDSDTGIWTGVEWDGDDS